MSVELIAKPHPSELAALSLAADQAARLLTMLSSPQRLMMLCHMVQGEASVGQLADGAGLAQSAASQHLGKLRAMGIVGTRRDGQNIYYRIADPAVTEVIAVLCKVYGPTA